MTTQVGMHILTGHRPSTPCRISFRKLIGNFSI